MEKNGKNERKNGKNGKNNSKMGKIIQFQVVQNSKMFVLDENGQIWDAPIPYELNREINNWHLAFGGIEPEFEPRNG